MCSWLLLKTRQLKKQPLFFLLKMHLNRKSFTSYSLIIAIITICHTLTNRRNVNQYNAGRTFHMYLRKFVLYQLALGFTTCVVIAYQINNSHTIAEIWWRWKKNVYSINTLEIRIETICMAVWSCFNTIHSLNEDLRIWSCVCLNLRGSVRPYISSMYYPLLLVTF
jgi:hypothetical protein